ncbi:hypothetical protein [Azospirillum argentinense]|uniref:twin-arginine translocation signal domain-containing protein n=1 Tax=Azospirillum argentinense TaxID=2970906 RepID=UPI0032DF3435
MKTRRQFLTATAILPVVAAVASMPPVAQGAAINPDAEILSAFQAYSDAYRQIDIIRDEKDPGQEAAYEAMYGAWDRIEATMPQTAAGLAAYLKVAFRSIAESMEADEAVIYGKPLNDVELRCCGEKMLWKLIQHLEGGAA